MKIALMVGVSGMALAIGAAGPGAHAANECGVGAPGGTVTCTPAGNDFPNGIEYQVTDLTVVVQDGVIIDTTGGGVASGGIVNGIGPYGDLVIKAGTDGGTGVTITTDEAFAAGILTQTTGSIAISFLGTIDTSGLLAYGIRAYGGPSSGAIIVSSTGEISTLGDGSRGILAFVPSGPAVISVTNNGDISTMGGGASGILGRAATGGLTISSTGDVSTTGDSSYGIKGLGDAAVVISSDGSISTQGDDADGITASSGIDRARVYSDGAITTSGKDSDGIYATSASSYAYVTASGTIATSGDSSAGIKVTAPNNIALVESESDITTTGFGSRAITATGTSALIDSAGQVSTAGDSSTALLAQASSGIAQIQSKGDVSTGGTGSDAISAVSGGTASVFSEGDLTTQGASAWGIRVNGADQSYASSSGTVTTEGDFGFGIRVLSSGSSSKINASGAVSTTGEFAHGLSTYSDGAAVIDWNGTIATLSDDSFGIHAYTKSGDITVTSTGEITTAGKSSSGIGAFSGGAVSITSDGSITTEGAESSAIYAYSEIGGAAVASTGDIATLGSGAFGIFGYAKAGAVVITSEGELATASGAIAASTLAGGISVESDGDLTTTGTSANAIFASAKGGGILVTSVGDIATIGTSAVGIQAIAPNGAIKIESEGAIATLGTSASAISATSDLGGIVITSDGALSTQGTSAGGIFALTKTGAISIDSKGTIATLGTSANGISATSDAAITIASDGAISTAGLGANGISATGDAGNVTITAGSSITTTSDGSAAILAFAKGGDVDVTSAAAMATLGFDGDGIRALSVDAGVTVMSTGNITTQGEEAQGILAIGESFASITSTGSTIRTSGADSHAIQGQGDVGSVIINAGTAIATGEDASGIHAVSAGPAGAAQIGISGAVAGGWGANGYGVFIDANFSSVLTIQSGASVGALSDVAVKDNIENLTIVNQGTVTGMVLLGSGADSFSNQSSNSWNLRNFADTDGDGVRDTEGVAIADFGAGSDSVSNTGTLSLAAVAGATKFDTAGQIAHPAGGNAEITQEGIEQGFLTNLESFSHSGLITLQDGAAGDLLVITDQADGGTAGNNVFTSNGGRVALDVVLDDGSSQQSDVLVLDKAVTGSGATTLLVSNAGGTGGPTAGDGILVVNVRTQSDADAFALDGELIAGAYRYDLYFQNAAKTDENWYLRSSFFEGALDYPSISSGALETWYSDLGGLHERLGERRRQVEDSQTAALPSATDVADTSAVRMSDAGQGGWFRVVGADMDIEQDGAADFDLNSVRAEAGFDVGFDNLLSEDWLVLGAFAGYGWSSLGFGSDADADFDIATVGAYATYFRGPYYLDALVKFDWLDGNYHSDVVEDDGEVELPVFGLSLETGYRFDLTQGGLYLQPQAQLSYAHVGDDRFADDTGAEIRLEDADSLRGRIGARLGQELTSDSGGAKGNFYLEASASQEFLGETEANVTGLAIEQELPETRFEVGAGFDIALPKDGVSFTLDADYVFGDEVDGVAATGGFRISW